MAMGILLRVFFVFVMWCRRVCGVRTCFCVSPCMRRAEHGAWCGPPPKLTPTLRAGTTHGLQGRQTPPCAEQWSVPSAALTILPEEKKRNDKTVQPLARCQVPRGLRKLQKAARHMYQSARPPEYRRAVSDSDLVGLSVRHTPSVSRTAVPTRADRMRK